MIHAVIVLTAVVLCLACAFLVRWVNAPMFREPRADGNAAAVRPALEHHGVPITDPASVRAKVAALVDCTGGANPYPAQTQPQLALAEPVVPRWYQAWEQGRWTP